MVNCHTRYPLASKSKRHEIIKTVEFMDVAQSSEAVVEANHLDMVVSASFFFRPCLYLFSISE